MAKWASNWEKLVSMRARSENSLVKLVNIGVMKESIGD